MPAEDYEVIGKIGHGSFGDIRKVRRISDGLLAARKEVHYGRMTDKERAQLSAELNILKELKHENIVQYYSSEHRKEDFSLHIYMEYCGGGDLGKLVRDCKRQGTRVKERDVWDFFAQIALALFRCHYGSDAPSVEDEIPEKQGRLYAPSRSRPTILHRDLKPENVFLGDNNWVKLGDFGLSKLLGPEQQLTRTFLGTPYYMSPELISQRPYTSKTDIWSLGCVIYELCQLAPPFLTNDYSDLCHKIRTGKFPEIPSLYSTELRQAISACLQVNPEKRPDISAVLRIGSIRLARRERIIVKDHAAVKEMEAKVRQMEALLLKERNLLEAEKRSIAREFEKHLEEKGRLLRYELDSKLREEWEERAEKVIKQEVDKRTLLEVSALLEGPEFKRKVEEEVVARLEAEVEKRIRMMNLVPAFDHRSSTCSNSSGTSSSDYPEQDDDVIIPDSPGDITMLSPQPYQSVPGIMQQFLGHQPSRMDHHRAIHDRGFASAHEAAPARLPFSEMSKSAPTFAEEPYDVSHQMLDASPVKHFDFSMSSPLAGKRGPLRRAITTNALLGTNNQLSRRLGNLTSLDYAPGARPSGIGRRGEGLAKVALRNELKVKSLAEISKENVDLRKGRSKSLLANEIPAVWDFEAEGPNMPSPFKKH